MIREAATAAPKSRRTRCRHRSSPAATPAEVSTGPSSTKSAAGSTRTADGAEVNEGVLDALVATVAGLYDLRGIGDTLDPADRLAGLVRFKLATGADVVEGAGEWELVLSPVLHAAFRAYLRWRS